MTSQDDLALALHPELARQEIAKETGQSTDTVDHPHHGTVMQPSEEVPFQPHSKELLRYSYSLSCD